MYYKIIDNNQEKWLLLLHCICSNMHIFDTYIEQLSEKYNLLLVDLPGHGNSKTFAGDIEFSKVAKELVIILDKLDINSISIWGISLGGVVAKYLLERIPHRIDKIIFEDPALALEGKFYLYLFRMFNTIKVFVPKAMYLRAFIFVVIPGKRRKDMRVMIYEHLQATDYNKLSEWLTKLCEEYKNKDFSILNNSKISKTYILGDQDYIFKNGTLNNIKKNKYNRVVIKKSCGHLCHLETKIDL